MAGVPGDGTAQVPNQVWGPVSKWVSAYFQAADDYGWLYTDHQAESWDHTRPARERAEAAWRELVEACRDLVVWDEVRRDP